jgi:amidohydrolase
MSATLSPSPVTTFTDDLVQEMVATRRDLHQHPELAFEEVRTSGIVAERLRALGLSPRTGVAKTGVLATVPGGSRGKTVLLRADMDALPIEEENDTAYRSRTSGKMHACGHDCHTSILLGIARRITVERERMKGAVTLCFQPAEECGGGAESMIADGALASKPDAAFGLHVWQDLDLGQVGVTPGPFMAAVDEFTVTVRGKGAHAAMPHLGVDPVLCLSHMVAALQTIASRHTNPFQEVVVSVTRLEAGSAFNIIPETAWMNGTVRVFDRELWAALPGYFERIVRGVAAAFGCSVEIEFKRFNQPTVNDPAMAAIAREAAAEVVGAENVRDDIRTMGGEDFSVFLRQVPGCFIAVGSRNVSRGLVYGHHHPRFDVDEACLAIGAEILLRTARRFLDA